MSAAKAARAALLVLATLRATRFITSDWLGEWWLVGPAKRWAWDRESPYTNNTNTETQNTPDPSWGWRSKLVKGLDCPFCVGFWLGALALLGDVTLGRIPGVRAVWRFGVAAFALNYVVGHASRRLDS